MTTNQWEELGKHADDPEKLVATLQSMPIADIAKNLARIARNTGAGPGYERFREPATLVVNERLTKLQVTTAEKLSRTGTNLTIAAVALAAVQAAAAAVTLWTFFHR